MVYTIDMSLNCTEINLILDELFLTNTFTGISKILSKNVNKKVLEAMIESSCFDDFGYNKKTLRENLDNLIRGLNPKYQALIKTYDDLDHAIAAHWGPNAFGYIYVKENK